MKVDKNLGQIDSLEGPLDTLQERIEKEFAKRASGYTNLYITQEESVYIDSSYMHYCLHGLREETETEKAKRKAKEAKVKAAEEAAEKLAKLRELNELARLKKKYPEAQ